MIVFYTLPNTLSLPYKTTQTVELRNDKNEIIYEDGKVKLVEKEVAEFFRFVPGKNKISSELWLKIVEYNKEDWDYYCSILKVFKPKTIEVAPENNKEDVEKVEVGEDEEKINFKDLTTREFKELIENTMEVGDLKDYLKFETGRDRPRPSVLKTIKARKAKISKADEVVSQSKKG